MRNGRLLAEEAPHVLLSMYGCPTLEEVFLKLSRKQGSSSSANVAELNVSNNISLVRSKHLFLGPNNANLFSRLRSIGIARTIPCM